MDLAQPQSRPAKTFDEAMQRVRALQALDDASILDRARTTLLSTGARTPSCVVLLHGITNHPGQYCLFAPQLFERGHTVLVPRLPEQGDRNRMTTRLQSLTAERLLATATEAIDIAQGLGERVTVLGISTSGLLCAYAAQYRADVARSIPVNPVFGLLRFPAPVSFGIEKALLALPNFFVWWDPVHKMDELPTTGYPRFPTHALAQCLRIGDAVRVAARSSAPLARSMRVIMNAKDPAVNNAVTGQVVDAWRKNAPDRVSSYTFESLPKNHDIIDPENAVPRLDIVYPKFIEAIEAP